MDARIIGFRLVDEDFHNSFPDLRIHDLDSEVQRRVSGIVLYINIAERRFKNQTNDIFRLALDSA